MINKLLLKNVACDDIFAENLFFSFDKMSALKADYQKILNLLKVHYKIEVLEYRHKNLVELHTEKIYILKADDSYFFIRLIIINNDKLADVLVYTLYNDKDIQYYKKIFFASKIVKPTEEFLNYYNSINSIKVAFIKENNHFKLIYETNDFLKLIGYEDWDFENKYQNYLDMVLKEDNYLDILSNLDKDNQDIKLLFNTNKELSVIIKKYLDYYFMIVSV